MVVVRDGGSGRGCGGGSGSDDGNSRGCDVGAYGGGNEGCRGGNGYSITLILIYLYYHYLHPGYSTVYKTSPTYVHKHVIMHTYFNKKYVMR